MIISRQFFDKEMAGELDTSPAERKTWIPPFLPLSRGGEAGLLCLRPMDLNQIMLAEADQHERREKETSALVRAGVFI